MTTSLGYRRDVDGLRALAIVPVVLFHLKVPGVAGGFAGVDVFFVISGFLITSIILREISSGSFSFGAFYERRARRLFPALFAMLAIVSVAASALMLPMDLVSFGKSLASACFFGSNVYFWKSTSYFADIGDSQPLLHTWSLAVEEQFYLVFPIALLLVRRLPSKALSVALLIGAALSFAAGIHFSIPRPEAVFYLPVFRAWELCLGALVAVDSLPRCRTRAVAEGLGGLGLGMIVYSVLAFSEATSFPAPTPLVPCLGAALVLFAGRDHATITARLLGMAPLVFLGTISYSLYLWHWPLWVFTKYFLLREISVSESLGIAALSVAVATVSWRWVEQPFRGSNGVGTRQQVFLGTAAAMAAYCAIGLWYAPAKARTTSPEVAEIASVEFEKYASAKCSKVIEPVPDPCRIGTREEEQSFVVWGDSHALAMGPTISEMAARSGRSGVIWTKDACAPLLGVRRYDRAEGNCLRFNENVADYIRRHPRVDTVVLVSRWAINALGTRYRGEGGAPKIISPDGVSGNLKAFTAGLERTLRFLVERKIRPVLMTQAPDPGWRVASGLARARLFGRPPPPAPTLREYQARQREVSAVFTTLGNKLPFTVVDVSTVLCPGDTCMVEHEGRPLYRDHTHLSPDGNALLLEQLSGVF